MNTIDKMQELLKGNAMQLNGYSYKPPIDRMVCVDGTTLSVQASETAYSTPRSNTGPYTEVEVWCISNPDVTEFEYSADDPAGYVPIKQVAAFIDRHGGLKD